MLILMSTWTVWVKEKLPDKKCFYSSVKDGITNYNDKKLDGHISHEDYLMCK